MKWYGCDNGDIPPCSCAPRDYVMCLVSGQILEPPIRPTLPNMPISHFQSFPRHLRRLYFFGNKIFLKHYLEILKPGIYSKKHSQVFPETRMSRTYVCPPPLRSSSTAPDAYVRGCEYLMAPTLPGNTGRCCQEPDKGLMISSGWYAGWLLSSSAAFGTFVTSVLPLDYSEFTAKPMILDKLLGSIG